MTGDTPSELKRFAERLGARIASRYGDDGVIVLRDRHGGLALVSTRATRGRPPLRGNLPRDVLHVGLVSFVQMARADFAGVAHIEYDSTTHRLILTDKTESVAVPLP